MEPRDNLPDETAKTLERIGRYAKRLDSQFKLLKFRFGLSALFGLVPGIGGGIDALLAAYFIYLMWSVSGRLPKTLRARMLLNFGIDRIIGLIPFLGESLFKCNLRNFHLFENYLYEANRKNSMVQ